MWPVVLGMGPHKGLTTALLRVGVRNSRELVYRVLEVMSKALPATKSALGFSMMPLPHFFRQMIVKFAKFWETPRGVGLGLWV